MPHFPPDLGHCLLVPTLQYCAHPSSLGLHPHPTFPDSSNLSNIPFSVQQLPIIPQSFLGTELCLLALNRKLTIPLPLQLLSGTSSGSLGEVGTLLSLGSLYSPWTHLASAQPIATLAYPSSSFPHLRPGDPT